jgi:hypothetical protein
MRIEAAATLGPATVLGVEGDRVRLDRGWAQLALAHPYRPEPGDVVLAIGDEEVYVIGVLLGRGKTVFEVEGDLELRATGRVSIVAGDEVETRAPIVSVRAGKVDTVAESSFERVEVRHEWVTDSIHTQAGRIRTTVEGDATLHAGEISQTADRNVRIDGGQILLG